MRAIGGEVRRVSSQNLQSPESLRPPRSVAPRCAGGHRQQPKVRKQFPIPGKRGSTTKEVISVASGKVASWRFPQPRDGRDAYSGEQHAMDSAARTATREAIDYEDRVGCPAPGRDHWRGRPCASVRGISTTGAINRYPRRGTVSIYCGVPALSFNASRTRFTALFRD